jgi:hypothetical protein
MKRVALAFAFAAALVHGQYRDLLLPARGITAMVVDHDGRPVADVRIDHDGNRARPTVTGADGKFRLVTRAPALVLRKTGYRSFFMRTTAAFPDRIVLERADSTDEPRVCSAREQCDFIAGWQAEFCFPRVAGVSTSAQSQDADYGIHVFAVKAASGAVGIRHGSGPMWTFGIPVDDDVWRSVEYSEVTRRDGKIEIVDARGQTADGKHWRYLGRFGESASYRDVDDEAVRMLDRVLDGVCIRR